MPIQDEVLAAGGFLVDAYGAGNFARYLACFTDDASFVFYNADRIFWSLEEWAIELARLEAEGNLVISCKSCNARVQVITPEVALYIHEVVTVEVGKDSVQRTLYERETITFHLIDGRWMAVHEDLSARPVQGGSEVAALVTDNPLTQDWGGWPPTE